jgi:HTH-type transcriptional regulator / antitoxin HipB
MNPIISALKQARIDKKLKQTELGAKLGLPQSHISRIEQGATDPRLSTILDMARVLDQELIMIPRPLIPVVCALVNGESPSTPRWTVDEEGDEE